MGNEHVYSKVIKDEEEGVNIYRNPTSVNQLETNPSESITSL